METIYKQIPDKFKLTAFVEGYESGLHGPFAYETMKYEVRFCDEYGNKGDIPVNADFMKLLMATENAGLEMEIKIVSR